MAIPTLPPSAAARRVGPRHLPTVALVLLIVLSLAAGIGLRSPSPPDEPRFVLAARTMVETGQWLLPHRGIEIYAEKPPVFMWLQAVAHGVVNDWNLAFLLPSLLAALLTLWMTYRMGCLLWNRRMGRHAALALFATLQFGLMAKRAQIDMVLVAMTTAAMWGLLRHLLRGPDRLALFGAAAIAALGTITKGVGFLPLLVLLPWGLLRGYGKLAPVPGSKAQWLLLPAGFVAGLAVWLLPLGVAYWRPHAPELDAYVREILFRQTATRYVGAWHHIKPAWYYAQVILTLWLPGCLLLPRLVPAWWRRVSRGDARYVLLIGWVLLTLLFFSASPGKREVYILPALPIVCLAAAPLLPGLLRQRFARIVLFAFPVVIGVAALVLAAAMLLQAPWMAPRLAGRDLDAASIHALACWVMVLGVVLMGLVAWLRLRRPGTLAVLTMGCIWAIYGLGIMPALDPSASARQLMQRVDQAIGPGGELGLVDWREQNYLQALRPPIDFGFKQPWDVQWHRARAWVAAAPSRRWILVTDKALGNCVDRTQAIPMGQANRNAWVLVPASALLSGCKEQISWTENDDG
ncbi:ArnT family glycosyltransferase [Stenotrophomonas tumulicola]|uniref:Glycosyltransferase family 39 protein n=1 Tax=Stenotrophomonas tumulicola TaxID=1685415 RepID=A0A7W3FJW8_9GAMM|nr:glycosyltransferase family 39 protein [Stenotrophomonas tumulicola]MBA8680919.1 glycosyltransferase family 39 protein [Stenotrophomonas tumulicola]